MIGKPYSLQPEDEQAISNVQNKGLTVRSWLDKELDSFKENMRNYLREKQNGLCAFCRMKIHEENATAELEHFVNKNSRLDVLSAEFGAFLQIMQFIKKYQEVS